MKKIFKKHWKELLIDTVCCTLFITVIMYLIVGPYNSDFVSILQFIAKDGIAVNLSLVMFPVYLILCFLIKLGTTIMSEEKVVKKSKKTSSKK